MRKVKNKVEITMKNELGPKLRKAEMVMKATKMYIIFVTIQPKW